MNPKEPVSPLVAGLLELQQLGEPLRLDDVADVYVLRLRTDAPDSFDRELERPLERLEWPEVWEIVGALVSRTQERGELEHRDALLDAAKDSLEAVLAVRAGQLRQRLEA